MISLLKTTIFIYKFAVAKDMASKNQSDPAFKGNDAYRAVELLTRVIENPKFRSEYLQSPVEVVEREFQKKLNPEQRRAVEEAAKGIKNANPGASSGEVEGNAD